MKIDIPYESDLVHALNPAYAGSNQTTAGVPILPVNELPPQNDITADPGDGDNASGHSCMTMVPCGWVSEDTFQICGAWVSCESIPKHYKDAHGIRQINESKQVGCRWTGHGKSVLRKNFVRHIREVHLGHPRE